MQLSQNISHNNEDNMNNVKFETVITFRNKEKECLINKTKEI